MLGLMELAQIVPALVSGDIPGTSTRRASQMP
jgi:hypothetical protein